MNFLCCGRLSASDRHETAVLRDVITRVIVVDTVAGNREVEQLAVERRRETARAEFWSTSTRRRFDRTTRDRFSTRPVRSRRRSRSARAVPVPETVRRRPPRGRTRSLVNANHSPFGENTAPRSLKRVAISGRGFATESAEPTDRATSPVTPVSKIRKRPSGDHESGHCGPGRVKSSFDGPPVDGITKISCESTGCWCRRQREDTRSASPSGDHTVRRLFPSNVSRVPERRSRSYIQRSKPGLPVTAHCDALLVGRQPRIDERTLRVEGGCRLT